MSHLSSSVATPQGLGGRSPFGADGGVADRRAGGNASGGAGDQWQRGGPGTDRSSGAMTDNRNGTGNMRADQGLGMGGLTGSDDGPSKDYLSNMKKQQQDAIEVRPSVIHIIFAAYLLP